jgi:hypothetical protein
VSHFVLDTYLDPSTRDEPACRNVEQLVKHLLDPSPKRGYFSQLIHQPFAVSSDVRGKILQFAYHRGDLALFQKVVDREDAKLYLVPPEVFGWMRKNTHPSSLTVGQIRGMYVRLPLVKGFWDCRLISLGFSV